LFGFSKPRNFALLSPFGYLTRLNIGFLTACGCILFNVLSVGGEFAANVGPRSSPNSTPFSLLFRQFDPGQRWLFKSLLGFLLQKMKLDGCDGLCEPSRVIKKAVEE
jgi:hypothetical protein